MDGEDRVNEFIKEYNKHVDHSFGKLFVKGMNYLKNKNLKAAYIQIDKAVKILRINAKWMEMFHEMYPDIQIDFKKEQNNYLKVRSKYWDKYIQQLEKVARGKITTELYMRAAWAKFEALEFLSSAQRTAYTKKRGVFSEKYSPFYLIKYYIRKVKTIYDEAGTNAIANNQFMRAYTHLHTLGDVILNEIVIAKHINDFMLYDEESIGQLYFDAGEAFFRAYKVIKDKYVTMEVGPVLQEFYIRTAVGDLFPELDHQPYPQETAILCFEKAREIFYRVGNRRRYLMAKDKLAVLKALTEDFEFVLIEDYISVLRIFSKYKAPFLQILNNVKRVKEKYIRDFFLSHLSILVEGFAVAEQIRFYGRSDLVIVKQTQFLQKEAIAEFKIWGVGNYKKVIAQLRKYLTDFENFGIIVMINTCKTSRKKQYVDKIIRADKLLVPDSIIEKPFEETHFVNFESKHYRDSSKQDTIKIYHFIINLGSIY